jgi:hypothetical protein
VVQACTNITWNTEDKHNKHGLNRGIIFTRTASKAYMNTDYWNLFTLFLNTFVKYEHLEIKTKSNVLMY